MTAPPRGTIANIQALRALASLMVVVVHLGRVFGSMGATGSDTGMFTAGVDLFFVISGFIMVYTTERKPLSPAAFMLNRIARLAPIYWFFTLIAFMLALVAPGLFGGTVASAPDLVRSLLFVPYARADGLVRPILFVGWSLNLEMMFYGLFALSLFQRNAAWRCAALIAVLVALVLWHGLAAASHSPVVSFLTQPLIMEFGIGMVIAFLLSRLPHTRQAGWVAIAVVPFALIGVLWLGHMPSTPVMPWLAVPAAILVIGALVAERAGFRLDGRPIQALGNASYALYLTHPFVTQLVTRAAQAAQLLTPAIAPMLVLLAIGLSVAVALAVHRLIERPLGAMAHRLLRLGRDYEPRAMLGDTPVR